MIRAVSFTSLWFGTLVWVILAGSFLSATAWLLYEDFLFAYESKPAVAIVDRKYFTVSHGRHGSTTTYHLAYHYVVGRTRVGCRASVENATYSSVAPGQSVPVLYLPAELVSNRIELPAEEEVVKWDSGILIAVSLFLSIGGGWMFRYYLRRNRLYHFLLASGLQCQGTVTAVRFNLVGKAQTKQYYLEFTFHDNRGQLQLGSTWYLMPGTESLWDVGRTIPVYFDPKNSERFTVNLKS